MGKALLLAASVAKGNPDATVTINVESVSRDYGTLYYADGTNSGEVRLALLKGVYSYKDLSKMYILTTDPSVGLVSSESKNVYTRSNSSIRYYCISDLTKDATITLIYV